MMIRTLAILAMTTMTTMTVCAGCSLLSSRSSGLQWTVRAAPSISASEGVPALDALGVSRPRVMAPWSSTTLVYVYADGEARADQYNAWVMPVDQLLHAQITDVLTRAGVAKSTATTGLYGAEGFTLATDVEVFGAVYDSTGVGVSRVTLHCMLIDRRGGGATPIADRTYTNDTVIGADNTAGVVAGLDESLSGCLRDLVRDLRTVHVPSAAPTP